jgi:hypothetical protein
LVSRQIGIKTGSKRASAPPSERNTATLGIPLGSTPGVDVSVFATTDLGAEDVCIGAESSSFTLVGSSIMAKLGEDLPEIGDRRLVKLASQAGRLGLSNVASRGRDGLAC